MRRLRSGLFWAALASAIGFAIILAAVAAAVLSTGWASAAEAAVNSPDTIVQRYQQAPLEHVGRGLGSQSAASTRQRFLGAYRRYRYEEAA
jgi:hypothetical protein